MGKYRLIGYGILSPVICAKLLITALGMVFCRHPVIWVDSLAA